MEGDFILIQAGWYPYIVAQGPFNNHGHPRLTEPELKIQWQVSQWW